ncbi:MAG: hypothetical protein KF767_09340 [Bdellovibrionaceae bacterium]|nr:hypothetical protein [Pseudobdellovibrionaceae bacterium]
MKPLLRSLIASSLLVNTPAYGQIQLDVSGRHGRDAAHGYSYSGSAASGSAGSSGSHGADGGDAGLAERGENAGRLRVQAHLEAARGEVILSGEMQKPGSSPQRVGETFHVQNAGVISLVGRGGNGGRGGWGGDGQDGGRGGDGWNATESGHGTDGGNGGRGGDAGHGSDGADGGNGAEIELRMRAQDTAVLLLVKQDIRPGVGGEKGAHGRPGSGGHAGQGGSSHTWTEVTGTREWTDSEGKTHREDIRETRSNPGGSDGWSGSGGLTPSSTLLDGQDGKEGKFEIAVVEKDGTTSRYREAFDLQLQDFKIIEGHQNGVLEPSEKITVAEIRVKNTGQMPTPAYSKTFLTLKNGEYFISNGEELVLEKSLQPGEEHVFERRLSFTVKESAFTVGEERWRVRDTVRHEAFVPDVNRPFERFDRPREVQLTFPVEIEPVEVPRSLAAGESGRFLIRIKNISSLPLGVNAQGRRDLSVELDRNFSGKEMYDNPDAKIKFAIQGQVLEFSGPILQQLLSLDPGGSLMLEGKVQVPATADPFTSSVFRAGLNLDGRAIQARNVELRVSQTYRYNNEQVLLVVNSGTPRQVIQRITEAAGHLGQKVAVWDLSYYSTLALTEAVNNGSTLADDFKKGTFVLLADDYKNTTGETERANDLLRRRDLISSISEKGANFLVMGENPRGGLLGDHLVPVDGSVVKNYDSLGQMMDAIKNAQSPADLAKAAGQDYTKAFSSVEIARPYFFGQPKEKTVTRRAKRLADALRSRFPDRRFVVVADFKPEAANNGLLGTGLLKRWRVGRLEIRETLDPMQGRAFGLTVPAGALGDANAGLNANEFYTALLMSQSMTAKANAFVEIAAKIKSSSGRIRESYERMLGLAVDAMLADLAHEQVLLRDKSWGRLKSDELLSKMRASKELLSSRLNSFEATVHPTVLNHLVRLVAEAEMMADRNIDWVGFFMPLRRNERVNTATELMAAKLREHIFGLKTRMGLFTSSARGFDAGEIEKGVKAAKVQAKAKLNLKEADAKGLSYLKSVSARLGLDRFFQGANEENRTVKTISGREAEGLRVQDTQRTNDIVHRETVDRHNRAALMDGAYDASATVRRAGGGRCEAVHAP